MDIPEAPPLHNDVTISTTTIHADKKIKLSASNIPKRLTRKYLQSLTTWPDWQQSEYLQLDQYEKQDMFGPPTSLPKDGEFNVLPFIWTYLEKACGRKKARGVCNGAPNQQGSITLDNTYAACLEQPANRIFWGTAAIENLTVWGADASNAFGEAPPPKAPLYLRIDAVFREWWEARGRPPLRPDQQYVRVNHAIQGHPEAARLWQIFADKILFSIGFKPTRQEPCLYTLPANVLGEKVYLLRQVDDFAVACKHASTAEKIWSLIDEKLKCNLKREGIIKRFNGIDVTQTANYNKLSVTTYIEKLIRNHKWTDEANKGTYKIPMKADKDYIQEFDTSTGPTDLTEKLQLEKDMGFKFRAATGELIFAMVTCRPEISNAVIKLTQFNNNPARIHYEAAKHLLLYLYQTKNEGLYFWRTSPVPALPELPDPVLHEEPHETTLPNESKHSHNPYSLCDSDWAGDIHTRRSISGTTIIYAGAAVLYKCMFQPTIALSNTEAEFHAISETGKMTLYVRSVLDDLGIEQHHATTIYEDNLGCVHMVKNNKPTRRTRHVDVRQLAIIDWVAKDLLTVKHISTQNNTGDILTKPLPRILFFRHADTITGLRKPLYATKHR